jgi:hypothetical protein
MPVSQNEGPAWKNQPGPLLPQKGRGVLATVGKSKISCNKNPLWKTVAPTFNSKAILVPAWGLTRYAMVVLLRAVDETHARHAPNI